MERKERQNRGVGIGEEGAGRPSCLCFGLSTHILINSGPTEGASRQRRGNRTGTLGSGILSPRRTFTSRWLSLRVRLVLACLLACLTSQQHASVFQGRVCSDNCMYCHTEIEGANPTEGFRPEWYISTTIIIQSRYTILVGNPQNIAASWLVEELTHAKK